MLNSETKQKIDNARDILVGKIPDPKGQVEQITHALIYKFMDEQDATSKRLGGKPTFFVNGLQPFAWHKLFDSKLSNEDKEKLYDKGVRKLAAASHLQGTFRKIFKDARLPFSGADTVALFLNEINRFDCDDTEKLGDALEYLIAEMGAQGKAGQFRTPRHIIDFIVAATAPQHHHSILDPACGTAGFLISAYQHISRQQKLTPKQKHGLARNIRGIDIDPGMAKIANVNLYLHGFKTPDITEDDTLTNEALWHNQKYDCILANPPFMTPKGGIRPHSKFAIQANRSEVLFVDYIAEHLKLNGRAGIIVPEGIIFKGDRAYKELRKQLVELRGLYAVVSLPGGVFQPYSPVKTSILLLDRAVKSNKILFVKVKNDGFSLSTQRKQIKENDLPLAAESIAQWRAHQKLTAPHKKIAFAVNKNKIAADGDYNLTAERYRETETHHNAKWDMVALAEVCEFVNDKENFTGEIKYFSTGSVDYDQTKSFDLVDFKTRPSRANVFPKLNDVGFAVMKNTKKVILINNDLENCVFSTGFCFLRSKDSIFHKYLYFLVKENHFQKEKDKNSQDGIMAGIRKSDISKIKIPLPPIEVQRGLVTAIDRCQQVIDGAQQAVDHYHPQIEIHPDWPTVTLGEVCEFNPKKSEVKNLPKEQSVSFLPMADLNENQIDFQPKQTKPLKEVYAGYTYFADGDVLLARVTPCFENGKSGIAKNLTNGIGFGSSEYFVYRADQKKVLPEWIYYCISDKTFIENGISQMTGTGGLQRLSKEYAINQKIPLPPIKVQEEIVAAIDAEQQLINGNRQLITKMQTKIAATIATVWEKK